MPLTPQQKKFQRIAKAANAMCHRETASVSDYKGCMSAAMSEGLRSGRAPGKRSKRKGRKGKRRGGR